MGIAALVLGIISFITAITFILAPLGAILAVIGLILGIVDTVKKGKRGEKKAISIAGLILSAVMFVILIVESILILGVGVLVYDTAKNYDTNTIVETIEDTAIETFNGIYNSYEGTQTGTRVKSLLSSIDSNNTYGEHQIEVYYNGEEQDPYFLKESISYSGKYSVSFYKDLDGYIYKTYITSNINY